MRSLLARLGPGLLYAGAAVGVSHLVQSTRAGANYGLWMVLVVVLANVIKYPFFKAGPLYAAQNNRSLLEAFHDLGWWAMGLFYLVSVGTMFAVQAAVTLITASVIASIFGLQIPLWLISAAILLLCCLILIVGKYSFLNMLMKIVIITLSITTIIALIAAFSKPIPTESFVLDFNWKEHRDIFFFIALVGWMPAPLDISLWHSEWTLADSKIRSVKKASFDFEIGYWGTTFLAAAFVCLGSLILKGSGETLSESGAVFAGQVIGMYTTTLGDWSFLIVALAAFTTMFSTTLTVLDAFPRVLDKAISLSFPGLHWIKHPYIFLLLILSIGAVLTLGIWMDNMRQMIDFATSISFLTAPILASLIYWVCYKNKATYQLFGKSSRILAFLGITFLYAFSFYYLYVKI